MVGIGFFAPLPLAMMMPFMAGQSFVMGDAFGKAYQYGKRKISAMSNEEFNKLTPTDLARDLQTDYMTIIPSMKASIVASRGFQSFIIEELAKIIREVPKDIIKGAAGGESLTQSLTGQGDVGIAPELSASNIDFIKKDIAASQQNFTAIMSGWNNFWNAMAKQATLPKAYADTDTLPTTFVPPEFGDQSPPKIFDKEVNSAQNQLAYNKRIADAAAAELRAAKEKTAFENIPKFNLQTTAIQLYQITRGQLLEAYWRTALSIKELDRRKKVMGVGGGTVLANQYKIARAKQARAKKLIMNHITHARNVTATKMQANRDWNARIWQR